MDKKKLLEKMKFLWTNLEIDINAVNANVDLGAFEDMEKTRLYYSKKQSEIVERFRKLPKKKQTEENLLTVADLLSERNSDMFETLQDEIEDIEAFCYDTIFQEIWECLERFETELTQEIEQL